MLLSLSFLAVSGLAVWSPGFLLNDTPGFGSGDPSSSGAAVRSAEEDGLGTGSADRVFRVFDGVAAGRVRSFDGVMDGVAGSFDEVADGVARSFDEVTDGFARSFDGVADGLVSRDGGGTTTVRVTVTVGCGRGDSGRVGAGAGAGWGAAGGRARRGPGRESIGYQAMPYVGDQPRTHRGGPSGPADARIGSACAASAIGGASAASSSLGGLVAGRPEADESSAAGERRAAGLVGDDAGVDGRADRGSGDCSTSRALRTTFWASACEAPYVTVMRTPAPRIAICSCRLTDSRTTISGSGAARWSTAGAAASDDRLSGSTSTASVRPRTRAGHACSGPGWPR